MLLPAFLLIAGEPAKPLEWRAWMDCLTAYAQVQMFGRDTAAAIAIEALSACRSERAAYVAWVRKQADGSIPIYAQIAKDDRDAGRMTVQFVNRYR